MSLLLEPFPRGPGGVVDAVEIGRDYFMVHFVLDVRDGRVSWVFRRWQIIIKGLSYALGAIVEDGTPRPGNTSVGNKDIETAAKFFRDQVNVFSHVGLVSDVDLVSLACRDWISQDVRQRRCGAGGAGRGRAGQG